MIRKFRFLFTLSIIFLFSMVYVVAVCTPNWYANHGICQTDDTSLLTYSDANVCNVTTGKPVDDGTYTSCNYCSEYIHTSYTDCVVGEQTEFYVDENYITCCQVTNIIDDCSIDHYPFNITTVLPCAYGNLSVELGNLSCQINPNIGINDKEYCIARIPLQYMNESFKCLGAIYDGTTGEIIQTTPIYKETSQTFFNLNPDAETRQYFTPANNIVNFYYTGKNLKPEQNYILTIECSSEFRTLKSEMRFQRVYEDVSFVFFRTRWLMDNSSYIIGGAIIFIIVVGLLLLIWRWSK